MRPFTVLIGILLGSSASISFGLGTVLVVFTILTPRHPELAVELRRLLTAVLAFLVLTAASASSFRGQIKSRPWRYWAHAATLACLLVLAFMYWPRSPTL